MNRTRVIALLTVLFAVGCAAPAVTLPNVVTTPAVVPTSPRPTPAAAITFSLARYPAVSDHIRDAIAAGESKVCTLDRGGADRRRVDALQGHPTAKGKDRDEYPFAVCREGGRGSDVRLVPSGENRSAGAWMGDKMERWPDGTRVLVVVSK